MNGYHGAIEKETIANTDFRRVLYTMHHSQLVLMSLAPGEEIGSEVHEDGDQFFRIEAGSGTVVVDENEYAVSDGDAIIVPAGARHNVINTGVDADLKLYTVYSPPEHKDGVVVHDKTQASPEHFDGTVTE